MEPALSRRQFVGSSAVAFATLAFGPSFWREALAAPATPGPGPYGPLNSPDGNGIRLPQGFSSREIARAGANVGGYQWHIFPDGQATFATSDGGWILVSNSECAAREGGGSSAIRFNSDGSIQRAYRILGDSDRNCSGGPTPWGTWLSAEEWGGGQIWECDPGGRGPAVMRPAMGTFPHESACVDPGGRRVYMTEDQPDGCLYRFTPLSYPDLSSGSLEVAQVASDGRVSWLPLPDPTAILVPTKDQVPAATHFKGGEGMWFDSGVVYFTTKVDNQVHAYDTRSGQHEVIYVERRDAPLKGVDNITVSRSGDVYVCEDGGDMDICLITPDRTVARFLHVTGAQHDGSELTGVIFDPSGTRMYFSSQRAFGQGVIYEVSGPFRGSGFSAAPPAARAPPAPPSARRSPIRLWAHRRTRRRTLSRRGVTVRVVITKPGRVTLALRSGDILPPRRKDNSAPVPRQLVIARATRRFRRPGTYRVRLRPSRRVRRRLRRMRRSARVLISARLSQNGRTVGVASRRLRLLRR